ncbi:MAG TPA: cytochrome c [Steroidobacteraceae bacterium]|nr:cytochrome c [Steroidobacteraceae bacterium]
MRRVFIARAVLTTMATAAGLACAARPAPDAGPGWTGLTHPEQVITARQELMEHIELLMEPIDTIQVEDVKNPEQLRANAETIEAMLLALPHLFPPTTNRYDPKAEEPATLALPGIWKNFDSFYRLAAAAASAAQKMSETQGKEPLRNASRELRASCDACHTLYLRPYVPPKVLDSDTNFDFDSVLRK